MSIKDITLPFTSANAMAVVVGDTGRHHLGLKDVLYNFKYECQVNDGSHIYRPACKFIFFYVSGGAKQIVYWAIVNFITETKKKRIYFLDSIMKLRKPIPLGGIPPMFNGGALEVPLNIFFKVKSMDELWQARVK